jgi:hypothetical protein
MSDRIVLGGMAAAAVVFAVVAFAPRQQETPQMRTGLGAAPTRFEQDPAPMVCPRGTFVPAVLVAGCP